MKTSYIILGILLTCSYATADTNVTPQPDGKYLIGGHSYALSPGDYIIGNVKYTLLPKSETPTPAPKDPKNVPAPQDVEDITITPKVQPKALTRDDIIKSIQNNNQLSASAKREIIEGLQPGTPISEPSKSPNFDLLETFKGINSKPGVKSYTDETPPFKPAMPPVTAPPTIIPPPKKNLDPKKDLILSPITNTDPAFEAPMTDIGISIGNKIDHANPWDPTKPVPYGKLMQFWVKPVPKRPEKLKDVAYTWTVLPKEEVILWPDTTRIIVASGKNPQNYVVMLTASYVFLDGDKIIQKANQAITMVVVGDGTPDTPIVPGTGGTGGTTILPPPPDITGIAKQSYEWTAGIIRTRTYTDNEIKIDAKKIAKVFSDVARKIDGGELNDINDILKVTKTENSKAIKAQEEWIAWFEQMSGLIRSGYTDNTIRTPQQYSLTWKEIAKGLDSMAR